MVVCSQCVLFSAYMEGSSNNKLFDIQNRCSGPVTLRDYELKSCGNGCSDWEHTTMLQAPSPTFQLAPNSIWRVVHASASSEILSTANQTNAYLSNGNDVYAIHHLPSNQIADVLGPMFPGPHPPDSFALAGVAHGTKDHTLLRKPGIIVGNCGDWDASSGTDAMSSEWTLHPKDSIPSLLGGPPLTPRSPSSGSAGSGSSTSSTCAALMDCPMPPDPSTRTPFVDRRSDKTRLTIATWNAEWLFDGVCDPSASPWDSGTGCVGYANGLNSCDAAGAALKMQRAAEVIRRMDADVINLVEVEGCQALNAVAPTSETSEQPPIGSYEAYLLTGTDTYLKQQVGLLTRITPWQPLERSSARETYPVDDQSTCGSYGASSTDLSKHYLARLRVEGLGSGGEKYGTLIVLGIHFKAIPTDVRSCNKREGQAKIAQHLLATALSESVYVVAMGDLNDFDADACCQDAADSAPTSRVLRMLKDPRRTGDDELHSVASRIPKAERYTDWWDHSPRNGVDDGAAEHSSLDHMLVSTALFDLLSEARIDHTHQPMDVSDHWPIIATFDLESLRSGLGDESRATGEGEPSSHTEGDQANATNISIGLGATTLALRSSGGLILGQARWLEDGMVVGVVLALGLFVIVVKLTRRRWTGRGASVRAAAANRILEESEIAMAAGMRVEGDGTAIWAEESKWELNEAAEQAAAVSREGGEREADAERPRCRKPNAVGNES